MKSGEMPEFKHPSLSLEKNDWGCLHCWTSNEGPRRDASWALIKSHLKEKCVQHTSCYSIGSRLLTFWLFRHDIEKPTEDDYYCARPTLQRDYFLREAPAM